MTVVDGIAIFGVYPASILFLLVFAVTRSPWWRDALGWVIFSLAAASVLTYTVIAASLVFGDDYPGRDIVRGIAFTLLTVAYVVKTLAVIHERRNAIPPETQLEGESMSHVNPTDPTQVSYPWKTAVRTAIQTFIAAAGVLTIVAPQLQEFIDQFWPGSPVVAWIGTGSVFIAALAGLVTRIMAIEAVNAALTRIGLGATPR